MFHATAQEQPLQAPAVQQAKAVQETQYAKRQLRAAWISTAWNIDWPSRKGLPSEQQKQEFIQILDDVKQMGMNAVVVQVRPMADAF
ncbi:family 10 glycosylhydrolase, partial [Paenibacillus larvae subsp. larvae]